MIRLTVKLPCSAAFLMAFATPMNKSSSKRTRSALSANLPQVDPYDLPWLAWVSVAHAVQGASLPRSYVGRLAWSSREEQQFIVAWQNGDEPTMYQGKASST